MLILLHALDNSELLVNSHHIAHASRNGEATSTTVRLRNEPTASFPVKETPAEISVLIAKRAAELRRG